jgi:Transposase DDE domain group 1
VSLAKLARLIHDGGVWGPIRFRCSRFQPSKVRKSQPAFDGGRLSSDGGVMLLSMAERRLGVAERLARCLPDRRDRSRIAHTIADMIRARAFAICCGYEDADDLDVLRCDPAFKLACGRLPDSGRDPIAARKRAGAEGRDPPDLCARRPWPEANTAARGARVCSDRVGWKDYNTVHPHSRLGYRSLREYIMLSSQPATCPV